MLVIVGLIQYQPDVHSSSKFDSVGVILTRRSCLFIKAEFIKVTINKMYIIFIPAQSVERRNYELHRN